jgi:hypothetical protein
LFFTARCTWPILAAFTELALNSSKNFVRCFPKFVLNVLRTNGAESGGTENCDKENFYEA